MAVFQVPVDTPKTISGYGAVPALSQSGAGSISIDLGGTPKACSLIVGGSTHGVLMNPYTQQSIGGIQCTLTTNGITLKNYDSYGTVSFGYFAVL